ncbi:MAG TPA: ion channel [Candidatus Sulfopaludibacter sp.]|jgi:inward rectifier potassium channel|nr:ion channel [Candidatus Sulfopaludibacter sp.]
MKKATFDPGLTQQFTSPFRRVINKDGSFNVHRRGSTWRDAHPYLILINMGWTRFFATVLCAYFLVNVLFAVVYYSLGPRSLQGADAPTEFGRMLNDFFFSSHTLSTVGYGNIFPNGVSANSVAALESLVGVLGFAVATGLLFGRVSRPSARIGFSDQMLIAPYQETTSLQFRVVNRRTNDLMDLEARMMLMRVEEQDGKPSRSYTNLKLEREQVVFLPLTWTIVHPIDSESPLYGKSEADLKASQTELLIVIKAYDDTFSQTVIARHSYRYDEILWHRRFSPAFYVDESGDMVLELPKLGEVAS